MVDADIYGLLAAEVKMLRAQSLQPTIATGQRWTVGRPPLEDKYGWISRTLRCSLHWPKKCLHASSRTLMSAANNSCSLPVSRVRSADVWSSG